MSDQQAPALSAAVVSDDEASQETKHAQIDSLDRVQRVVRHDKLFNEAAHHREIAPLNHQRGLVHLLIEQQAFQQRVAEQIESIRQAQQIAMAPHSLAGELRLVSDGARKEALSIALPVEIHTHSAIDEIIVLVVILAKAAGRTPIGHSFPPLSIVLVQNFPLRTVGFIEKKSVAVVDQAQNLARFLIVHKPFFGSDIIDPACRIHNILIFPSKVDLTISLLFTITNRNNIVHWDIVGQRGFQCQPVVQKRETLVIPT